MGTPHNVKIKPATPLPWTISQPFGNLRDHEYAMHAANSYPRLVEALRRITSRATHHGLTLTLHKINLDELRALLRSLGESE